jgi:L-threonylcarbamoyladenylate synthase
LETEIIKIDRKNIDIEKIKYAAGVINSGGIVVFPTETVYGLGANGLNEEAVRKVFIAKGRPQDNPLILHISHKDELSRLVKKIPPDAHKLMTEFWPGPLTLIFEKSGIVPKVITAGLDTVAIRMPRDPIANMLIRESRVPIAAPSANISGKPSGTDARHVIEDLKGKVDVILDAGDSEVGLESTVLDITVQPPVLLRPGGVTIEALERVAGRIIIDKAMGKLSSNEIPRSPGMKYRHYSPDADVYVINGELDKVVSKINEILAVNNGKGIKTGVLATDQTMCKYVVENILSMGDRNCPETIARNLFRLLREMDERHVDVILVEAVDSKGIGFAVMNRLKKASGQKIVNV